MIVSGFGKRGKDGYGQRRRCGPTFGRTRRVIGCILYVGIGAGHSITITRPIHTRKSKNGWLGLRTSKAVVDFPSKMMRIFRFC